MAFQPVRMRKLTAVALPYESYDHGTINYRHINRQINGLGIDFSFITQPIEQLFTRPGRALSNIVRATPEIAIGAITGYGTGLQAGALTGAGLAAWGAAAHEEKSSPTLGTQLLRGTGYGVVGGVAANVGKGVVAGINAPSGQGLDTFFSSTGAALKSAPVGSFISGLFTSNPTVSGQPSSGSGGIGTAATVAGALGLPLLLAASGNKTTSPGADPGQQVQSAMQAGYTDPNQIAQMTGLNPQMVAAIQALMQQGYSAQQASQIAQSNPSAIPQLAAQASMFGSINPWYVVGGLVAVGAMYFIMSRNNSRGRR